MGVLDEIKAKQTPRKYIVKAKKRLHKGFLFGHISNGGGIAEIEDGLALRFTADNDKFVIVEVIDYGKYSKVETQTWNKTKEVTNNNEPKINIKKNNKDERKKIF